MPSVVLAALWGAVMVNLNESWSIDWRRVPFHFGVFAATLPVVALAITSVAILARAKWIAFGIVSFAVIVFVTIEGASKASELGLTEWNFPHVIGVAVFVLCFAAIFCSWRQWQSFEFGRQA